MNGLTYINPGSAALPKENQPRSCMTLDWERGLFEIRALSDGTVLRRFSVMEG